MKRRKGKRKQDAKAAAQVKFSGEIETPATHVEIPADTEGPAGGSTAIAGADRRTHPRYKFTAAVDLVSTASGARIETRVRDLSQQGCYVDTDSPFPLQTVANVRITKKAQSFEALARVVYSQISKGMGLVFTAVKSEQLVTLEAWVSESRETSWLASNRRRSQRVLMKVPVRVSGHNALGSPFEEETQTVAVSAHGALIPFSTQVKKGQRLALSNVQTKLHWSVLSPTSVRATPSRWEWSSCCPIRHSGTWPFRRKTGHHDTQMQNPRSKGQCDDISIGLETECETTVAPHRPSLLYSERRIAP